MMLLLPRKMPLTLSVDGLSPLGFMSPELYTRIIKGGWLLMPMHMK